VARQDAGGLRAQELGPRGAAPAWSRIQAVAEKDRPDARRRDVDTQLQQFSADAEVPPSGVLGAEANDMGADLRVYRWPAGWPLLLYVHFLRTSSRSHPSPDPRLTGYYALLPLGTELLP